MNLREDILNLIESDDSFSEKDSYRIFRIYDNASNEEKDKIDGIFTYLCGFSLGTIIIESQSEEEDA